MTPQEAHLFPPHRITFAARALSLFMGACAVILLSGAPEAQAAPACDDAADVAVLSSPLAPWMGAPLRVIFAAE
jgi:hypothetical protein